MTHDMEMLSALLVLYVVGPPVTGGFSSEMASNAESEWSFLLSFNKLLGKQSSW